MEIKKVMVIGAGQMGGGIAQVCAQAGFDVKLNDIKEESYVNGLAVITKNLSRNVEKGARQAVVTQRCLYLQHLQSCAQLNHLCGE